MQAERGLDQPSPRPPSGIYAYTAREWDPEINLYYYRARYYDPKIGRFISEDPIRLLAGLNFYEYVSGNPVRNTDPSGLLGGPIHYNEGTWVCTFYWGAQTRFDLWYRGTSNRYAHTRSPA